MCGNKEKEFPFHHHGYLSNHAIFGNLVQAFGWEPSQLVAFVAGSAALTFHLCTDLYIWMVCSLFWEVDAKEEKEKKTKKVKEIKEAKNVKFMILGSLFGIFQLLGRYSKRCCCLT